MTTIQALLDATWPAARYAQAGGFTIREGRGGGSRVVNRGQSFDGVHLPHRRVDLTVEDFKQGRHRRFADARQRL
jgi:hypothetical protein